MKFTIAFLGLLVGCLVVGGASAQETWRFRRSVDPITDEVRGFATVSSGEHTLVLKCDLGSQGVYADLFSRRARQASMYQHGDTPPVRRGRTSILERIDTGQPMSRSWIGEFGEYVLGAEETAGFARQLMDGGRLVLRIESRSGGDTDVIFTLVGSSNAIRSVYRTCGVPVPN